VHSVSVNLEPSQFLSGWRPESGAIFLPVLSEARVGDEVAARIGVLGQTIRATVFGPSPGTRSNWSRSARFRSTGKYSG